MSLGIFQAAEFPADVCHLLLESCMSEQPEILFFFFFFFIKKYLKVIVLGYGSGGGGGGRGLERGGCHYRRGKELLKGK